MISKTPKKIVKPAPAAALGKQKQSAAAGTKLGKQGGAAAGKQIDSDVEMRGGTKQVLISEVAMTGRGGRPAGIEEYPFGDLTPAARAQAKAMAIAMPRSFYNVGILEYASDRATMGPPSLADLADLPFTGAFFHLHDAANINLHRQIARRDGQFPLSGVGQGIAVLGIGRAQFVRQTAGNAADGLFRGAGTAEIHGVNGRNGHGAPSFSCAGRQT